MKEVSNLLRRINEKTGYSMVTVSDFLATARNHSKNYQRIEEFVGNMLNKLDPNKGIFRVTDGNISIAIIKTKKMKVARTFIFLNALIKERGKDLLA